MCLSFSGHKHPCVKHHLHGHLSAIKYLKLFVPHCAFAWRLFNNIPLMEILRQRLQEEQFRGLRSFLVISKAIQHIVCRWQILYFSLMQ